MTYTPEPNTRPDDRDELDGRDPQDARATRDDRDARITYREPLGGIVEAMPAWLDDPADPEDPAPPPLEARRIRLVTGDGTRVARRLSVPARHTGTGTGTGQGTGYAMLDNEILAGVRLARLNAGVPYPPEVSRLIGFDADSACPVAYLEPLRGEPVARHGQLPRSDQRPFQISLLRGVLQLWGAGIAHRRLSPDTVRWDGTRAQITDFSAAALAGTGRTVAGSPPWQPPEQRPGGTDGTVGDRDDLWAAGRLIFYTVTGRELDSPSQLADDPQLARLLAGMFARPDRRPSAAEVLDRLGGSVTARRLGTDADFERGRAAFDAQRRRKHPGVAAAEEPSGAPASEPPRTPGASETSEPPGASEPSEPSETSRTSGISGHPGASAKPGQAVWLWIGALALLALAGHLAFGR